MESIQIKSIDEYIEAILNKQSIEHTSNDDRSPLSIFDPKNSN